MCWLRGSNPLLSSSESRPAHQRSESRASCAERTRQAAARERSKRRERRHLAASSAVCHQRQPCHCWRLRRGARRPRRGGLHAPARRGLRRPALRRAGGAPATGRRAGAPRGRRRDGRGPRPRRCTHARPGRAGRRPRVATRRRSHSRCPFWWSDSLPKPCLASTLRGPASRKWPPQMSARPGPGIM